MRGKGIEQKNNVDCMKQVSNGGGKRVSAREGTCAHNKCSTHDYVCVSTPTHYTVRTYHVERSDCARHEKSGTESGTELKRELDGKTDN